ncbi:TetR/AcrR family transcriptional regulator [Actinophytocola sp.]|uniref:TetR/AcrR family transcriptional regulator n=1 Tax=Actinophytocola sp. TaxID=1872138 RepID=UPI00389A53CD
MRLSRAEQQERNRAAVLAAARDEFAERGYAEAKVDRIAERAELTRGAVYSNFPSKRALYLAVLLDSLTPPPAAGHASDVADALGAFAGNWLERLPLTGDTPAGGHLRARSLTGVLDDEPGRTALAQVARLEAVLLGRALESCRPVARRRVRLAELVLTLLNGAGHLAETAPGFGDPFDVIRACQHLADLDLADTWDPPHLPFVQPAQAVREEWTPAGELPDLLTGQATGFGGDGVIAVLGTGRLGAAEEAVRAAEQVTVVVVTSDHAELGRLVRLRLRDLAGCLLPVFGAPGCRVVLDDGAVAAAAGVRDADDTEAAFRVQRGEIVARAAGRGAAHAVGVSARSDR